MSFFYLTAATGDIPVHLLETIVIKRLEYIKALLKGDSLPYNEYVLEGGLYDNVGHFMLCIIAILGENIGFTQFFIRAEGTLFKRRVESLSAYDMRCFAKKLLRSIRKHERVPSFVDPLQVLCRHLVLKDLAQHVCWLSHSQQCVEHIVKLNFHHCLTFISKRQVELKNGLAFIPCSKWKQYIILLFNKNLNYKLNKTNMITLRSDPRLKDLLTKILQDFFPCINKASNILTSVEVDNCSGLFPPCMLNLHQHLRQKHRLSHSQRFYYSLFLKDIGMPVEEAIDFWRMEYRLNPNGSHSCCHSWVTDEKKYLYGIRHMYGLEGCRKSYTSVNCQRIQAIGTSCSEGGCPFKSFGYSKMVQLLKPSELLLSQINELIRKRWYTSACMMYLQHEHSNNYCDNLSFNFTPVKYYMFASNNKVSLKDL